MLRQGKGNAVFWDRIEPHITPRLEAAVSNAYAVFADYRLSGTITYCDCPVCMTAETAAELSAKPLKELSAELLAEYTNSAHGYDRETIEPQFKYFLPRYFDLIAHCQPPSHMDLDTCLTRLQGYREHWRAAEIAAVDGFFDAFVEASVHQLYLLEWPVGLRLEYDMGEVLTMIVLAGGDLTRVLAVFDDGPDPEAAVHMASMRMGLETRRGRPYYGNAFLNDYPEVCERIGAWLSRDSVTERIMAAPEQLDTQDYDDILNRGV